MFCKMIKTAENAAYEKEFKLMRTEAPALVSRKIGPSLHQSAQMIGVITSVLGPGSRLLSAGSFEDVPTEVFTITE
jgi:hypothetical protein